MQFKLRIFLLTLIASGILAAQAQSQKLRDSADAAGDTPDVAGPLATDLSPALKPEAIARAMRKVGNWELAHTQAEFNQDWTYAALYRGLLDAANTLHDDAYTRALVDAGDRFEWKLGPRETVADDQAIGSVYIDLYRKDHDKKKLEPAKAQFDRVMQLPDVCVEYCPKGHDQNTPMWWWCDALFMAPPVWADLTSVTGDRAYLDRMDRQWWATSKLLYDPAEHLYSRDASFLDKHEENGKKIFWSRGNGWVIAGLVLVLEQMPKDYPSRPHYVAQFRDMAEKLKSVQGEDGLWRPGLLNASAYPLPEVSGSAFYVYAMAWGIRHGILDRAAYLPAVTRGWAGLLAHVYADGRLGSIQPIGAAPDKYQPQSSYVFGVGAFLMAGSELHALAERKH